MKINKYIIISICFFCLSVFQTIAQTDSSLYKSYIKLFDRNAESIDPIEGIWSLDISDMDITKGNKSFISTKNYTVAIYKTDKYFKVQYLTTEFHQMERFLRLDDTANLLYDRPDEQVTVRTMIEGNTITCKYTYVEKKRTKEETRIFSKIYPQTSTTRTQ